MPTLLIGPLPERPDGLSMAFDVVVRSFSELGLKFKVLNINTIDISRSVGTFSYKRALEIIIALTQYFRYVLTAKRIYLLVGLSRVSFLRDFLFIWPSYLLRRRIVLHVHSGGYRNFYDDQPKWLKRLIVSTLMRASAIIILAESLREQFDFLPDVNILHVVPNCAPFETGPKYFRHKTIPVSGPVKLLYLSNLISTKGYLDCLEACRILHHDMNIPLHFSFCGGVVPHKYNSEHMTEQEVLAHFYAQVHKMHLEKVVGYYGIVVGEIKYRFLTDSHIFILPTYYPWEGQPISIIEALAFGMPVVSTHFRAIPEQVIDAYNGFLVHARNPVEIANKVEILWNRPDLYSKFSINAKHHFDKNFTKKKHLDKLMPIILGYAS